ncbi:MAG: ABC transporter permease [Candidatus Bathyarchaeota archaeon]|jgi:tungstate transport system permease protein|nr:ABC transporter permease [Candidatus Bathyarchaeota archaeon]
MIDLTIIEAFQEAFRLIITADPEVFSIVTRSIYISGLATVLACVWGIPISVLVGLYSFPGKRLLRSLFNALLGIPTVALGLTLYLLWSRSGPFGFFHLLYSPLGIAIGQSILITPILVSFASSTLGSIDTKIKDLAKTLGASDFQISLTIIRESFWEILLSITASFNRAFAELGVAIMIGGNIRYVTRMLTTSIALETARGDIPFSIALGIILMVIVLSITLIINYFRKD